MGRHPPAFDEKLLQGEELRECREALARAGKDCKLPCGTKVFVAPSEYRAAMSAMNGKRLGPSFVIVSEALEPVVMAAAHLPSKENVRVRDRQTLAFMDP